MQIDASLIAAEVLHRLRARMGTTMQHYSYTEEWIAAAVVETVRVHTGKALADWFAEHPEIVAANKQASKA